MTQPLVGCVPDDDCFTVLRIMEQHRLRRLPVLGIGGVLVGMVSMNDIVNRAAKAPASDPLRSGVIEALSAIGTHAGTASVMTVGR
jgi:predicted transcriptional regulator